MPILFLCHIHAVVLWAYLKITHGWVADWPKSVSKWLPLSSWLQGFKAMIGEWSSLGFFSQKNGLNLSMVFTVKQCSCTCCGSSVASREVAQMTPNNYHLPLRVAKKIKQVMEKRSERVMKMRVMTTE